MTFEFKFFLVFLKPEKTTVVEHCENSFLIRYIWYQCLRQISRLYIQIVYLVGVFKTQVRPREIYWIQKLNLAVWVLNCIVACAPHLRKAQMNSETQ